MEILDGKTIRVTGPAGTAEAVCVKGYVRAQRGEAVLSITLDDCDPIVNIMKGWTPHGWVSKGSGTTWSVDGADFITEFEYESLEYGGGKIEASGYCKNRPRKPSPEEIARLRALKGKA